MAQNFPFRLSFSLDFRQGSLLPINASKVFVILFLSLSLKTQNSPKKKFVLSFRREKMGVLRGRERES